EALLATARAGGLLRINPVYAEIVDGHLLTFVQAGSAKRADLESDDRYALHTHIDPLAPDGSAVTPARWSTRPSASARWRRGRSTAASTRSSSSTSSRPSSAGAPRQTTG